MTIGTCYVQWSLTILNKYIILLSYNSTNYIAKTIQSDTREHLYAREHHHRLGLPNRTLYTTVVNTIPHLYTLNVKHYMYYFTINITISISTL